MLLWTLVKLNNSISVQNFNADQKKGLCSKPVLFQLKISGFCTQIQVKTKIERSSLHSGSISVRNFRFLVAKWALLAKKPRGPDIFHPLQCQTRGATTPLPPQNLCQWLYCKHLFRLFNNHSYSLIHTTYYSGITNFICFVTYITFQHHQILFMKTTLRYGWSAHVSASAASYRPPPKNVCALAAPKPTCDA